jgi:hypothetical protein
MRAYSLECTQDFFVGRPEEPCSGAARLEHANSGATPLRSAASTAAMHSPNRSGADPPDRGWILAPASDEGNVNVRGSTTPDK